MPKQPNITILVKEPNKAPQVITIENEYEKVRDLVGGYIETVPLEKSLMLVCNEEGKMNKMPVNFFLCFPDENPSDIIVGPALFCSVDNEGEFTSLSPMQETLARNLIKEGKL
jgi:hypothetical protein